MSENSTKVCIKCGTVIEDGAKFCPNCGTPADQEPAQQPEKPEQKSENNEQPEEQNVRFCPKCGAKNQVNDKFCFECGYVLDESQLVAAPSGTPQQTPEKEEKKKDKNEKKEKKGINLLAVVGIAAVLVVAVVGAAVFMINRASDSKDNVQPLLYLKDNELTTVTGRKNQPFLITDRYYEEKDNGALYSGNSYPLQYTKDGKYMFYPKKITDNGRYDLYYRQAGGKGEEEKQDSDVRQYVAVSKNMVVYLKGDDRRLYLSDLKDKEKLADEVWDFWVTEDGRYVMWTQMDGDDLKLYVQDTKKSEKIKIDTITSLIDYSKDFSVLVYWKDGSVYVCRNFEDKENVARDVDGVYTFNIDTKLEIYYVKESDTEYTLYDFFSDKNAAADASMTEPVLENYQTVTIEDSFWGPQEKTVTDDKYYEDMEKYNEKEERDYLRESLKSYNIGYVTEEKVYHYVLGKEDKTLVAEFVGDGIEAVYGDAPMVYYVELDMEKFNEEKIDISLFEDNAWDEVMVQLNNSMVECANLKLIADNGITELTGLHLDDIDDLDMYYNEKTRQIYVRAELQESDNLYIWDYKKNKECELLTEQIDNIVLRTKDGIYYTADANDGRTSADLYLNDTRLESDVYPYSVKEYDGTLLYIRDVSSNYQEGALCLWKNNKREKIADDVAIGSYGMVDDGSIAYLVDYSFKYYRGDLMLYNGKKNTKVDTDVTCIFFERN